jgi:hypothetical protein
MKLKDLIAIGLASTLMIATTAFAAQGNQIGCFLLALNKQLYS